MNNPLARPDWIRCIVRGKHIDLQTRSGKSWCGRATGAAAFVSVEIALSAVEENNKLKPCPDCLQQIIILFLDAME